MKKILLLLLMISMGLSASQWGKENRNKKLSLIHRFIIASFSEAETADSVRVVAYIEIPYRTIQFIKKDNTFLGSYEASLSLSEKKGGQINRKIWKENIIVDSYDQSKSYRRNIKHSIEFIVPKGEFVLKGELVDLDTRKKGIKTKKISFRDTQKTPALLPPVFMLPFPGDWGFKPDLIPTLGQRVRPVEDDIKMMISGFVNPGDYEINVTIIDREGDDTLYNKIIENNEAKYFTNYVSIPASKLTKLKYEFLVILSQNGKKDKEIGRMTLARAGISKTVTDIEFALKQMKYILNSDERRLLKKTNKDNWDELFIQFWKERDPDSSTVNNELMEEYYERVDYAMEHFDSWQEGWRTDMGMIYILFGPPNEIQRYNANYNQIRQVWRYHHISKSFTFLDENGFGDYRLETPFITPGF